MSPWQGDQAFDALVDAHRGELLRLATLLAGDQWSGEDALHEALISVAKAWPRVRPATAMAYIRTAVAREASRDRRRAQVPLQTTVDQGYEELGFLRYEEDQELVRMLATLPRKQRAVLVLRYCFDFTDRDVALALHCTPVTVRSQAHRALKKLRDQLAIPQETCDDRR